MALSILLMVSVLSALSKATFGQSASSECRAAFTSFTASCAGSNVMEVDQAIDLYFSKYAASLANPLQYYRNLTDEEIQDEIAFFNDACARQECINLLANIIEACLQTFRAQVGSPPPHTNV